MLRARHVDQRHGDAGTGLRRLRSLSFASVLAIAGAVGSGLVVPASVFAAPDSKPKPNKEQQAAAAKKFKEGEKAFAKHDYSAAAEAFEEAYEIAPHPDVLLNAIDSRERAGDLAAAATWCAHLVREYPKDKGRAEASQRLAKYTPKLGRLDVTVKGGATGLTIDGRPVQEGETYVDPGDHVVSASFEGETVERNVNVVAGARATVVVEKGAPPPKADPDPITPPPPVESDEKPLHPAFFFVGMGLTVVAGGLLVWSGVDTNSARDDFDQNPTQTGLDNGLGKQTRTNVLIAVTTGLGVTTAALGIFAVEWGGSDDPAASADVRLELGPTGATFEGVF